MFRLLYTYAAMKMTAPVMRKCWPLLLLAVSSWPALAARSVTVGQLEQLLDTLYGKSDNKVAQQLSGLDLTERLSQARLSHWEEKFPGPKTHVALIKLADLAAFLNPPAEDVVPIPAPDSDTRDRMLELAAEYVKAATARLPDLFATRETMHFEDTPSLNSVVSTGTIPFGLHAAREPGVAMSRTEYKSLHYTGATSTSVTYRNGMEIHGSDAAKSESHNEPSTGLTTSGEFGPILSLVIGDAMRSQQMGWLRWEQSPADPVAVFRYSVPANQSNDLVRVPLGGTLKQVYPAYHGEIAIDPSTGAILRLSIVAEMPPPYQAMETAILVEYAPVTIGAQSYFCPMRGVAFSKVPVVQTGSARDGAEVPVQTQVNDVAFAHYHLFRSDARILTGPGDVPAAPQQPSSASPERSNTPPHGRDR